PTRRLTYRLDGTGDLALDGGVRPTGREGNMKRLIVALALGAAAAMIGSGQALAAPTCTPTGFIRDGMDLTAEVFNPATPVTGEVDATGCNIGVYFSQPGSVSGANVHGANYFG